MMRRNGKEYTLTQGEVVLIASVIMFGVGWVIGMFAAKVANSL